MKLVSHLIGVIFVTGSYTEPDCHDLLFQPKGGDSVGTVTSGIDKCFWRRFQISDPYDYSWFRCTTRRPSGVTGFTPNSLRAVLSRSLDNSSHMQLARRILENVCDGEDEFVPYDLLRFHVANVLRVNLLMMGETTRNPYKQLYDSILRDPSGGRNDALWHMMNIVGSYHQRNRSSITQTWISAALDAWLIQKLEPRASDAITNTFQSYWHSILRHMDSPYIMHIDEDVGQPLLDVLGDIYASSLEFDVDHFLKQLRGLRGRISRLDEMIPQP